MIRCQTSKLLGQWVLVLQTSCGIKIAKWSVRQGCPIFVLLFIQVAEILATSIKSNTYIEGINLMKREFKIAQLADDTPLS